MSYKYTNASSTINNRTPKEAWIQDFQENLNEQFYNASNVWTIKEESPYGEFEFVNQDVRITHVINGETGMNLGDDWKTLLFQDISHPVYLGGYYFFDDNYWIVVNLETIKNLTSSCTVRRCNNTLRWLDTLGAIRSIPCVLEYVVQKNRNYLTAGSANVTPSGMLECQVQMNDRSNMIRPNQRFLFGNSTNWTAYKAQGGGINNFLNVKTLNNKSNGFIRLSFEIDYVNQDTDDLVNGIANINENVYGITVSESILSGNIGQIHQLSSIVTLNNDVVVRPVVWSTSDETVALVDSSGLVSFISSGTSRIRCSLSDNLAVYSECAVNVILTPIMNYQIVVTPTDNFVYQGDTKTFTVKLYLNGVVQSNVMTFTVDSGSGVPSANYVFTSLSSYMFSVKNIKMYLNENLKINCVTGTHTDSVEIQLKGSW
jgi:hypothetical protein